MDSSALDDLRDDCDDRIRKNDQSQTGPMIAKSIKTNIYDDCNVTMDPDDLDYLLDALDESSDGNDKQHCYNSTAQGDKKDNIEKTTEIQEYSHGKIKQLSDNKQTMKCKRSKELEPELEHDYELRQPLQRTLGKVSELKEHRNTPVEIIGYLQGENEDLKTEADRLRGELENALTEMHILEKSYKAMQESYTQQARDTASKSSKNSKQLQSQNDQLRKELETTKAQTQKMLSQLMSLTTRNNELIRTRKYKVKKAGNEGRMFKG